MAQRIGTLIPLDEALARIRARVTPLAPVRFSAASAIGATVAEDVMLPEDHPTGAVAAADGWAVRSDETLGASPYTPAPLSTLPHRMATGDPLPANCDAILPEAEVMVDAGFAQALATAAAGQNVMPAGRDAGTGRRLLATGDRIGAVAAATLERLGIAPSVRPRPRLSVVPVGAPAATVLAKTLCGAEVETARPLDVHQALAAFRTSGADALILIGGSGEGASDHSALAVAASGELVFHGVAMDPGRSSAFGMVAGRPVLVLPRRPQAALAALATLGQALVDALGASTKPPQTVEGRLTRKLAATAGLTRVVYGRLDGSHLVPLGGADLPLDQFATVEGCILVPPSSEGAPAGASVAIRIIGK